MKTMKHGRSWENWVGFTFGKKKKNCFKPVISKTWVKFWVIKNNSPVEKREPFYTDDENVNLYSHYGEQHEGSLKNLKKKYRMTQQSHSWA